jgi:tRNA1(Val) A37 N6-methylase TrmN6
LPPVPPDDARRLGPGANEDLCFLAGDWRILQRTDGHRWSLDDLVTAWLAARETADAPPASLLDLGCGIGAVLMLLAWRFPSVVAVGIEAQAVSVDLARRSLAWNGIAGRCAVRHGDLRDASVLPADATFALVTATPPYLRPGAATASRRVQRGPCHVAVRGGIADYCVAAARWMAPGALFVTCEAAGNVGRVEAAAAAAGLAPQRRIDVVPRAGKAALLSVWAMRRTSEATRPVVEPPLVVRDADGGRTDAFRAVRRAFGMPP